MPIAVKGPQVGTANKTTATTTMTVVLTTAYATGDVLVVFIASDPGTSTGADGSWSTGPYTIADSGGNTYVNALRWRSGASAVATGCNMSIMWTQVTAGLISGSTVTVTFGTRGAKAAQVIGFSGFTTGNATMQAASGSAVASTTAPSVTLGSQTMIERVWIAGLGVENTVNTVVTGDTAAAWTSLTQNGTSGGAAGTNQVIRGQYNIQHRSSGMTWTANMTTSAVKAAALVTLADTTSTLDVPMPQILLM